MKTQDLIDKLELCYSRIDDSTHQICKGDLVEKEILRDLFAVITALKDVQLKASKMKNVFKFLNDGENGF